MTNVKTYIENPVSHFTGEFMGSDNKTWAVSEYLTGWTEARVHCQSGQPEIIKHKFDTMGAAWAWLEGFGKIEGISKA